MGLMVFPLMMDTQRVLPCSMLSLFLIIWHTEGFTLFYIIPFPDYLGKDRTFPAPLSLFSAEEVTAHHRSPPLLRNMSGSKITRSYFILKWNRFKYIGGMSSRGGEGEYLQFGMIKWQRAESRDPPSFHGPAVRDGAQNTDLSSWIPNSGSRDGLWNRSCPSQSSSTFQRGWMVQGQGSGGDSEGRLAGTEHPLLHLGSVWDEKMRLMTDQTAQQFRNSKKK